MIAFGMILMFGAYTVGGYGWVLLKGWDIPFRQWVSPLHPYQWPANGADPPLIPDTQLFPSSATAAPPSNAAGATTTGTAPGTSAPPAAAKAKKQQQAGMTLPGRLGP